MNFLCKLGWHQKRLVKHFISVDYNANFYYINYHGYECLLCKYRFLKATRNAWLSPSTLYKAEEWVRSKE